jgi:hypothetical protein
LELVYTDSSQLEDRCFTCSKCPEATKRARRCEEDRWDFTEKDDPVVFPVYVRRTGELYGFCPGKVLKDSSINRLFRILMISAKTGVMLKEGAIEDQPDWFVELLSWFIPKLDSVTFNDKVRMVLGGGGGLKAEHQQFVNKVMGRNRASNHRRPPHKHFRKY